MTKPLHLFASSLLVFLVLSACSSSAPFETTIIDDSSTTETTSSVEWVTLTADSDDWDGVKRADIAYQLLIYSFADSDGDGMGDLRGILDNIDYIDALGISAIWLSPIHPAMSYHGYDVTDYTAINPDYGTMDDFSDLVAACHDRGIRVYLDYVMNHTGADHPWFQSATASEESTYRDFYIFSQDPEADIKAGNIAMIETSGYSSGEWFTASATEENTIRGYYTFLLDWSNASSPTVTVTEATASDVDSDNPDTSTTDARYLYYGDGVNKKFYDKGNGIYQLTVDLDTSWGFLIRTSATSWTSGTKYGAPSATTRLSLGTPFTLDNTTAADILFAQQNLWYYHSHFNTSSFADLNYGDVASVRSNATYQAMLQAAEGWIDLGVDGLRLDAVKHIYHNAESDENPLFLQAFYDDTNAYYKALGNSDDFYMVGEVMSDVSSNSWMADYYKGLPALFDFSFWYRLQWAINNTTGCYFADNIASYQSLYAAARADYIDAIKLSNHDEDRTASVIGSGDPAALAAAVLLTSAGAPYIYYGEELGMRGTTSTDDKYVRGPLPWGNSYATTTLGITTTVSDVTTQQSSDDSLLQTYLLFTRLRNTYPALAYGTMSPHPVYNSAASASYPTIAAWYMTAEGQQLLVLHNFGTSDITLPLTDTPQQTLAVRGSVQQLTDTDGTVRLKMGKQTTAVFLL